MRTVAEIDREVRRQQLWLYALAATTLMVFWQIYFQLMNAHLGRKFPLEPLRLTHAILLAGSLIWLIYARRTVSIRATHTLGAIALAPLPFILWINQELKVAYGWADPMAGNRLAVVVVAVVFPAAPRFTLLAVSLIALTGLVHLGLWSLNGTLVDAPQEPWLLLFHWLIGGVIVFLRAMLERYQRQYQRARAALVALSQLAAATRALRDGANTPLQTIETIAFLDRHGGPRLEASANRLERSSTQLRRVLDALNYDEFTDWESDDLSFRAEQRLKKLRETLLRDAGMSSSGRE